MSNSHEAIWRNFCLQVQDAGLDLIGEGYPNDELNRTDGFSHLAGLLQTALRWVFAADPDFPRFCQMNDTPEIADNSFAAVSAEHSYRLTGKIDTLLDVNISVHEGWTFLGAPRVWGDLGRRELGGAPDGTFELTLSRKPHPGNWLELPEEAAFIQIREYYGDWTQHRPGTFEIVRIGSEGQAPPRLTGAALERKLNDAIDWAHRYTTFHKGILERNFPAVPNTLSPASRQPAGNRHIWYSFGRFALKNHEALVVDVANCDARLWSIQWLTSPWYENPDITNRITSLVNSHMHVDTDGRVRIVIAPQDPGVANWLDTGGHEQGVFVMRWIWCSQAPEPRLFTLPLSELATALPGDVCRSDAVMRRQQIAMRRAHFATRRR